MRPTLSPSLAPRHAGLLLGLLLTCALAHAQNSAPTPVAEAPAATTASAGEPLEGRRNQKIEHIQVEDSGARVDERRYGGVTQTISVTPKNAMPAYEVQSNDERRVRQGDGTSGTRVWNVLKF